MIICGEVYSEIYCIPNRLRDLRSRQTTHRNAMKKNFPATSRSERSQGVKAQTELREMILHGALSPGERVSELAMVDRLGMSRTPVRLALVRLEEEGLLEGNPAGGFVVRSFSLDDIHDAIDLRGTVEGLAAKRAAQRKHAHAALADLRDCLGSLDAVVSRKQFGIELLADYIRLNERFHSEIVRLAQSDVIGRMIQKVMALPFASPSAFVAVQAKMPISRDILALSQAHHRKIAKAIAEARPDQAETLMRGHAHVAVKNLEFALKSRETFRKIPGAGLILLKSKKAAAG